MSLENRGVTFARVADLPDHLFQFIKFDRSRSRNLVQPFCRWSGRRSRVTNSRAVSFSGRADFIMI